TDIYTETYGDSSIQTDRHIYTETYGHTLSFSHNLIALSLQHLYTHKITHSLFLDKVQSMSFSRMNMKMCVCVCVGVKERDRERERERERERGRERRDWGRE